MLLKHDFMWKSILNSPLKANTFVGFHPSFKILQDPYKPLTENEGYYNCYGDNTHNIITAGMKFQTAPKSIFD